MQEKSIAMAYVPWQKFHHVMGASDGLRHGTIFKDLALPFCGKKLPLPNDQITEPVFEHVHKNTYHSMNQPRPYSVTRPNDRGCF